MTHTTASTSHINNASTRHEVQRLIAEYATYGDFLSYPVIQETGAFNGLDPVYKLISGMAHVIAYAFLYHTAPDKRTSHFTAIVLDKSGKIKADGGASAYLIESSPYLLEWVDVNEFFYPGLSPAEMEAAQAPAKAVAARKAADTRKQEFLAACNNAPRPAKDKPAESITSKVKATPVKTAKVKAAAAAKPIVKLPSADEMRKAAKNAGVDVSTVNFRSSTQRAALAAKLGMI